MVGLKASSIDCLRILTQLSDSSKVDSTFRHSAEVSESYVMLGEMGEEGEEGEEGEDAQKGSLPHPKTRHLLKKPVLQLPSRMVSKQEASLEDSLNTSSMPGGLEDRAGLPGSFVPVLDEILAEAGGREQEKEKPGEGLKQEQEKERPGGGLEQEKERPGEGLEQEQEKEGPVSLTQKLRAFRRKPQDRKKASSRRTCGLVEDLAECPDVHLPRLLGSTGQGGKRTAEDRTVTGQKTTTGGAAVTLPVSEIGQAGDDRDIEPDARSTLETKSLPQDCLSHILKTGNPVQVEQRTGLINPQDHKPAVLSCKDEASDHKIRDQPEASLKQETCLIEDIRPDSLPLDTLTKILDAIKEREEHPEDQKPDDAKPANPELDDVNAEAAAARWATIIPLIGGSAIGCHQATGSKPVVHLTYSEVIHPHTLPHILLPPSYTPSPPLDTLLHSPTPSYPQSPLPDIILPVPGQLLPPGFLLAGRSLC